MGVDLLPRLKQFLSNPYLLFAVALLVSGYCKLTRLSSRELWLDETYSAYVATTSFRTLLRNTLGDLHPPLYHMLLWCWVRMVGDAPSHLRLFSAVLSLLATAAIFAVGRRALGPRFGAYAAALFAFSPMLFVYSLEVRSYMLFLCVMCCLLYAHWEVTFSETSRGTAVVLYALCAAALFYVHYLAVFILIGLLLHFLLLLPRNPTRLKRLLAAAALTVLFIGPGIGILLTQRSNSAKAGHVDQSRNADPQSLSYGDRDNPAVGKAEGSLWTKGVAAVAGVYPASNKLILGATAIPILFALAVAAFIGIARREPVCLLFVIEAALVCIGVYVLHLHATRYLLPIVPLIALAMARTFQLGTLHRSFRTLAVVGLIAVLPIYIAGFLRQARKVHGRPWANAVSLLQQQYRPGDQIVFSAEYAQVPFDYYARQAGFHGKESGFPESVYDYWKSQDLVKGWGGPVILRSDLDRYVADLRQSGASTVWLVFFETNFYDPHDALLAKLREGAQVTREALPPDLDDAISTEESPLRLYRVQRLAVPAQ